MIGQDVFDRDLIPADTDYRIYRDKLNDVSGLDFAFIKNGFTYHTPYDDMDHLEPGQIQHMGDNILAVTSGILQTDLLQQQMAGHREGDVFFDVFGLFMVILSKDTMVLLWNSILCIVLSFYMYNQGGSLIRGLIRGICIHGSALITAGILALLVSEVFKAGLFWYSSSPFALLLYSLLPIIVAFHVSALLDNTLYKSCTPVQRLRCHLYNDLLFTTFLGVIMAYLRLGISFLPLCYVVSSFLTLLLAESWKRMIDTTMGVCLLMCLNCVIPFAVIGYITSPLDDIIGPLCGKMADIPSLYVELGQAVVAYLHFIPYLISFTPFLSLLSVEGKTRITSWIPRLSILVTLLLLLYAAQIPLWGLIPGQQERVLSIIFSSKAPSKVIYMQCVKDNQTEVYISSTDSFQMGDLKPLLGRAESIHTLQPNHWKALLPVSTILAGMGGDSSFPSRNLTSIQATATPCNNCYSDLTYQKWEIDKSIT